MTVPANPDPGTATAEALHAFVPMAVPVLGPTELAYANQAIESGWISSQGEFVDAFEDAFAGYCGVSHGVAVTSGTTALHLALAALGIGPGDEVILPALAHIACINAVALTGATPVVADCELSTWGIDPDVVQAKITARTKAVMALHLFGHPVDVDPLLELGERHGFVVLEDAAQAHGAEYKGRRAGSLGRLASFSFYANKIITTGEGGMLVTDDPLLAARARKLRDQAYEKDRRFLHRELGFNYRMTNVQAAIGLAQMKRLDEFVETHRRNAHLLNELLADEDGLTLPPEQSWAKNVYWMYSLLVDPEQFGTVDELAAHLRGAQIDSRPFFIPLSDQPLYDHLRRDHPCPVAESMAERGISLPSGNELTERDVRRIADAVHSGRKN